MEVLEIYIKKKKRVNLLLSVWKRLAEKDDFSKKSVMTQYGHRLNFDGAGNMQTFFDIAIFINEENVQNAYSHNK